MYFWLSQDHPASEANHPDAPILAAIREVLAGNLNAFDEIVYLYREQVFGIAWNLTHDTEDALDITQEVFLRAYRALRSYRGKARFSTWLHRIALNTTMDYLRRESRQWRRRVTEPHDPQQAQDAAYNPLEQGQVGAEQATGLRRKERQRRVLEAIHQLSARQKQVILLRYYHDLTLPEIAKIMKCTEGAVKRHLFRAQIRLRLLLKDVEGDEA
ncbi:MAG: sigma-70 family RNA polymerase sigma factor [Candidatus Hydrogenedentota bacterium]|jgi:RNA polymerase sigma-70 factor (ECF subfamily)|uniref:RNA polymerase sigma factor n=1 Tax=Sumerlaea chitinivorans TaxID=2250252 RepID=A0A2Z4Y512_SUMC1|nr:RNA polymerase sigma factor RpoE [Candidatus Sumerlaea chitinivorans]RMH24467.1 MAG: sigma-70 family RNA polymerase sigma factor [Candidatus Hydrogenedentota bacterium]GIX45048.1 MAG: RNA polymerase sigma factor RpoE [Candidatus Sumerlaea sp.]